MFFVVATGLVLVGHGPPALVISASSSARSSLPRATSVTATPATVGAWATAYPRPLLVSVIKADCPTRPVAFSTVLTTRSSFFSPTRSSCSETPHLVFSNLENGPVGEIEERGPGPDDSSPTACEQRDSFPLPSSQRDRARHALPHSQNTNVCPAWM